MSIKPSIYTLLILLVIIVGGIVLLISRQHNVPAQNRSVDSVIEKKWVAPESKLIPATEEGELIKYGRELIANTSHYFGPKGIVAAISNGLNCQNCHLDAGTRLYANSFATVAASYPKYRDRSGRVESIVFRINECMERSMNGKQFDSTSKEIKAMVAYIKWVGKDVTASTPKAGTETLQMPFIDRAADTLKGKAIYMAKCIVCHGTNGEGKPNADSSGYFYPPLWGHDSYNVSAGMYRLTRLAPFIKYNMPYSVNENKPMLTDEEAWDVAAYISSQQRPQKFFSYDWPKKNSKPVDYPFGPFDDSFPSIQHKYGPFKEMKKLKDIRNQNSLNK
ncbi:MAG: c-type cytochrome [Bacteroidota bacterium]